MLGKCSFSSFSLQVRIIEVDKIVTVDLHFIVDGPGHNIPGSQAPSLIILVHELLAHAGF